MLDVKNVRDVFILTDFNGKGEIAITEQTEEQAQASPSPSPSASPSPAPEGD